MRITGARAAFYLGAMVSLWMTACGGGGSGSSGGGPVTPTVMVTPGSPSITTAQSLTVTISVSGSKGTPTGTVTLSSGSYASAATALVNGSATISIPAGKLATGTDMLSAAYTPDAASSSTYTSATGTGSVTVAAPALITPTVTVMPGSSSITTAQSLTVTVTVSGGSGNPTPTGSVTLTSGSYASAATALVSGSATISIPAGKLATGTDMLSAAYTPDTAGSATYTSATGTGSVTVTAPALITPTVTVSPGSPGISSTQILAVTVTVSGGSGNLTPTGSVTLTSGSYTSAATALVSGSAQVMVPAGSLAVGADTLTGTYTPDATSSSTYTSAFGTGSVTVTGVTPTVTVTPGSSSVAVSQPLTVTVTVNGGSGNPTPTGSVTLTSGSYTSSAATLSSGSAQIVIPGSSLAAGSDTLTANYKPDAASSNTYTSASGTGSVTVNTSVAVNQTVSSSAPAVTNQIMGVNMAVWYDFTDGGAYTPSNSPIVSAFENTGIVALRWPGGSTSDVYHWDGTSATNPANGVAPTPSTCSSGYQNSNTNYLNFIKDLEYADTSLPNGYDVALTADYGSNAACNGGGEPQEAADWVQYAYANGGRVSHVTVGNEEYGSWEEDLHSSPHNPTTYADAVAGTSGYYDLIKAQSSSTLVGVDVDADGQANGWDNTVLSNAVGCNGASAPCYDFVEYHFYPEQPGSESDTFLVDSAPQELTTNINTIKKELTAVGEPNIPIYVGEMGSVSSNPGKQSMSITQGLYAGQVLGEMMNDGVSRATWWIGFGNCNGTAGNNSSSLYGWQNFGAYNVFSDGPSDTACTPWGPIGTVSPTVAAFQLFSHVAVSGQSVLTASVDGDTTDVRAYAATNPNGTALVLFNLNETKAEDVVVTLSNESGSSSSVTEYTYDKEMYDYTNTNCAADLACTYDSNHDYSTAEWVSPTTTALGAQTLPLTVTLQPWSMNVLIIK